MNARMKSEIARHASNTIRQVRCASTETAPVKEPRTIDPDYGQQIWVYNHLQKNHVVYSLTKSLRNSASLRQLPFNGKKTVPAALRKDLWHPLATINFSNSPKSGAIGLSTFQKLREYRRRHELEWDGLMFTDKEGNFIEKKKRGRLICDQKANSIADMAAVLSRLNLKKEGEGEEGSIGLVGEGSGERVSVRWWNLKDAEFAETWSENVEHGHLELRTNNRDVNKVWGKRKMEMENGVQEAARRERAAEKRLLAEGGEVMAIGDAQPEKVTL